MSLMLAVASFNLAAVNTEVTWLFECVQRYSLQWSLLRCGFVATDAHEVEAQLALPAKLQLYLPVAI